MYEQNIVGAIDGCHVLSVPPAKNKELWQNRKAFFSQNILAAIDFDGKFLYMCTGWEGFAHDAQGLKSVLERENVDFHVHPIVSSYFDQ